jgi:hypothetical protein
LSYAIASAEFLARFIAKNPQSTEKQQKSDIAQRLISLKYWLNSGTFLNNVGRDKVKSEHELAVEKSESAQVQAFQAAKSAKVAGKIAEASKIEAARQQAAVIAAQKIAAATKNVADKKAADDRITKLQAAHKAQVSKALEDAKLTEKLRIISDAAKEARAKAEREEAIKQAALKAQKAGKKDVKPVVVPKVQTSESKISPLAGCSEECRVIALETLAELEELGTPRAAMLELARLIMNKYAASK